MKRAACVMLFVGLLLLPAVPASAKPIDVSTSTFASSSVSSTVSEVSDWFQRTLGIDLFGVITKVINFMIVIIKVTINILIEILPKIRDFLPK